MNFSSPPAVAAWLHQQARTGFEVAGVQSVNDGWVLSGCTSAVEEGEAWVVDYQIEVAADWTTRSARVTRRVGAVGRGAIIEGDGRGRWRVDGVRRDDLDGCLDIDLESSALTNAFPVHRLALEPRRSAEAPAAYIRTSLAVERLEQTYTRMDSQERHQRFQYRAPVFGFECELLYDASGFALSYPGIAVRTL